MCNRVKQDLILYGSVFVTTLICILLLISNVQGAIVKMEILGGTNDQNPVFKLTQEIEIKWDVQLPNYESYDVSVTNLGSNKLVKEYKGKLSSTGETSGSANLSGLDSGNYRALLIASPRQNDMNSLRVPLPANFNVINHTYIRIIKYNDKNGNGYRDANEMGIAGWKFKVGRGDETPIEGRADTGEDGSIVITDPSAGDYTIEEIPHDGWFSTNGSSKRVPVAKEKATTVEFGNIPAGNLKITSFADLDENKAMGGTDYPAPAWNFVVNGADFNQPVITGADGTANLALKPGQYTVSELTKKCWTASGDATQIVVVRPEETASVLFGNIPQANITIWAYQDVNSNGKYDAREGVPGVTFTVTGPQGTSILTSGQDGSARYNGRPGAYGVAAIVPEEWILITSGNKTETLGTCDDKQMMFEVRSRSINISDLVPKNNAILSSTNVSFSWKTSEISSSELYIKQENESNYSLIRGIDGIDHSINKSNLIRNAKYNFYVKSEKGLRSAESNKRSLLVNNGICFAQKTYEFDIKNDYEQHCPISVMNLDSKPHRVHVNISSNNYTDIYLGFLGEGSADKELTLAPGETKNLDLVIHAQDAVLKRYAFVANLTNLGSEKIVDYARVYVNVLQPQTDFNFEEISADPINLTKTFRVKNLKDPIRDLSITPDDNLRKDVVIQPSINHASLGTDESIVFSVSPIWSKDVGSVGGLLTASAGTLKKDLHVDFSCEKGRQLYNVTLPRPLLHFDMSVYQCINAYSPIDGVILLPPGLTADDIAYAKVSMDLDVKDGLQTPYDVWATINGKEVGRISKDVFSANYEFDINPIYLSYATAGSAINRYSINDTMPHQYRTYISNVKVLMCLKELKLKICAENQQQAKEIAWRIPWIYRPSNKLNVTILEPKQGDHLVVGTPTTIKAKVDGDSGGEKYSFVRAKTNNSVLVNRLVNNGQYEDGVYVTTWIPDASGISSINVTASNCATIGSNNTFVMVAYPIPRPGIDPSFGRVGVIKSYDPSVLDISKMDKELGNVIKYTIEVVPIGGIKLKDVRVIENLPNYITLNNSSVMDRGTIQLNHDGKKWSTTNITWDIGDLDIPRSLTFEGIFHWRLPADAQHVEGSPLPESVMIYRDYKGARSKQEIPEGELTIGPTSAPKGTAVPGADKKQPGFEALFASVGITVVAYRMRKVVK